MDEYRTSLRLYTHYARLEFEYFQRKTESRRIFDLCFQTVRSNPSNFSSFESANDLCYYVSSLLICEFELNELSPRMIQTVLSNAVPTSIDQEIDRDKLRSTIEFLLKKLFPNDEFNQIISLLIDTFKSRKVSKWDQKEEQDWSNYLRQNVHLSLEILLIFLNYSCLLNDPFEKLHQILCQTLLPLLNEQRTRFTQSLIDDTLRFYLSRLWNELFTEQLHFEQCTNYLKEIYETIQFPSAALWRFTAIYTCFLPFYGSSVSQFEQLMLHYRFNQRFEFQLINKSFVLLMNFLRHIKIHRANLLPEQSNSGYEHRVRHILRQLIREYPIQVQLWLFYEDFERYVPNNQTRIKAVLYDAMQNCPWIKVSLILIKLKTSQPSVFSFFLK